MSLHATRLRVGGTDRFVAARLHDELRIDDLFDAEALWSPARVRVLQALSHCGVDPARPVPND
jgi:hypothetical protein